jgi:riboflavin synthase
MFNGIIEKAGKVKAIHSTGKGGKQLIVDADGIAPRLTKGDSISVDGVCLTVTRKQGRLITLDLSPETLNRTNLGGRQAGDRINLEQSITPSTPISGHFVQGHVEGVGRVKKWIRKGDEARLFVELPSGLVEFCVSKGSIAVNGVSLTIASLRGKTIEIALIPYTLQVTNLGELQEDDAVNIETDMLGRYVVTAVKKAYHSLKLK